jgi:transposase InsO family protein
MARSPSSVWARLRHAGLRTSKERVRRLMRENGLQATTRPGRPRGPRSHDGTIIPETIDTMWDEPSSAIDEVDGSRFRHRNVPCWVL